MKQSLEFSSRLLGSLASPELEAKIIQMALERLHGLRSSALAELATGDRQQFHGVCR